MWKEMYIYITVAENKANVYKFLSKQRLNLSAAVLKNAREIHSSELLRQDFENLQCFLEKDKSQIFPNLVKGTLYFQFCLNST